MDQHGPEDLFYQVSIFCNKIQVVKESVLYWVYLLSKSIIM
jgi:hypothetical protein